MPDETSLQDLQDLENLLQHKIDLLNQADQLLKQELEAVANFTAKHPHFASHGHAIADAVKGVETILTDAIQSHNSVVAKVKEAKESAQQYDPQTI